MLTDNLIKRSPAALVISDFIMNNINHLDLTENNRLIIYKQTPVYLFIFFNSWGSVPTLRQFQLVLTKKERSLGVEIWP